MRLRFTLLPWVLVGGLALSLSAQETPVPRRRAHHAMVYDEAGRRVLLTAGSTPEQGGQSFTLYNDLWAFDGSRWQLLGESGERISGIRLAPDPSRGRILSFGGYPDPLKGQLRALRGSRWELLGTLAELPVAESGFVLDSRRSRFVAFSGSQAPGQSLGDTWEYDGTAWHRGPAEGPSPRMVAAMVYDERRGVVVLFGGGGVGPEGQGPRLLGDTWEYDGARWIERVAPGPTPRHSAGFAYDARRGLTVVFGGIGAEGVLGDTWGWDGTRWAKLADAGPDPRALAAMAYDKARDQIVLFGGRKGWPDDLADTWLWDGSSWSRVH